MTGLRDIIIPSPWAITLCALALAGSCELLRAQEETPSSPLPERKLVLRLLPATMDSTIRLPDEFIAHNTDTLRLDTTYVLLSGQDYVLEHRSGALRFDSLFFASVRSRTGRQEFSVTVRYRYFPFRFKEFYALRTVAPATRAVGRADSLVVVKPSTPFTVDDIFGTGLQKSGSIVRGFTFGSNRDLSLNSGLRMQLAGRIASDVEIAASLTDENTPIQPEGTTQTLQEFDKVFVEIKSTDLSATLGDFVLDLPGTTFAKLSRKLQGAKGMADYTFGDIRGTAMLAGAITRGKFTTRQFTGLDGVQGPYILTGQNNERAIIVIAGTERVYVDGELQTRGELNDYVVDYSTGEVVFTARRLITSRSRIVIDYEYTDRQFSRSLLAAQTSTSFFDNKARLTMTFLREADDPDSPIDFTLSDSARAVLAAAGGDRDRAVQSGVTRVDSNGSYIRVDTVLVGGALKEFYRYAPGDPAAVYTVTFSFVGAGRGEYTREQAGLFVWRGVGGGDYLPVRYLPMPQSHRVIDVGLDAQPLPDLRVAGELAHSEFSANRFSSLPGTEQQGHAISFQTSYAPRDVTIGTLNLGSFDFRFKERFMDADFLPVDRANDIEFTRKWGVDSLRQADEEIREASLQYHPIAAVSAMGGLGSIRRGAAQQSTRYEGSLAVNLPEIPKARYAVEDIRSSDNFANVESAWLRQRGSLDYLFGIVAAGVSYEGERRTLRTQATQVVQEGSFQVDHVMSSLQLKRWGKLSLGAQFGWEWEKKFQNGAVVPESKSFTQAYTLRLAEWNSLSSSLDVTLRDKAYTSEFRRAGNNDVRTVLVRNQSRYTPLNRGVETDLVYQVSTELSSRLERVFVRVNPGSGSYRYLGDVNGNGLADDDEFVLTRFDGDFVALTLPTDRLFPIIDLKTSVRLRVTPRRFLTAPSGFWEELLALLSSESYVRVEEKSTEQDLARIYLLHLSAFQRDSTTIAGSILFTQDLNVMEGNPLFSARARFSERRGMGSYSGGIERAYVRERSLRFRWQLIPELSNQLDLTNRLDRATGSLPPTRQRDIVTNGLSLDFSYRPEQNIEFGWKVDVARSEENLLIPTLRADFNAQTARFVTAFQGAGQARIEFSREEILLSRSAEWFPYELTGGRVSGKTWLWRVEFEYRLTQFLQATARYDGRSEGGASPIHTGRMEVRAFF